MSFVGAAVTALCPHIRLYDATALTSPRTDEEQRVLIEQPLRFRHLISRV
ncbi:MAG TPA: hypothetical protein VE465_24285 [Streptosporangiaceae bacterium]|jgi:hypothetical protein|nr:hypothetical protein [Streptosporangiaceae bacterium]